MRFQSTAASCGPASLRNALLARGIARSEEELARLAGCTTDGTTARGMMRALLLVAKEHHGILPGVLSERRDDIALLKLVAAHRAGCAAILCVDDNSHWAVSFGMLGDSIFHLADSADDELVLHLSPEALLSRWKSSLKNCYYALIV